MVLPAPGAGEATHRGPRKKWHPFGVIVACHTLIYSDDAEATRAFFRDVLGFQNIDAGTGDHDWLIFRTGPSGQLYQPRHQTAYGL